MEQNLCEAPHMYKHTIKVYKPLQYMRPKGGSETANAKLLTCYSRTSDHTMAFQGHLRKMTRICDIQRVSLNRPFGKIDSTRDVSQEMNHKECRTEDESQEMSRKRWLTRNISQGMIARDVSQEMNYKECLPRDESQGMSNKGWIARDVSQEMNH
jgi:hypothetical protein